MLDLVLLLKLCTIENGHIPEDVRPDPTIDLHWSSFAGAIQHILVKNAAAHPERLCVVETASSTRNFTYRHFHEASNVVPAKEDMQHERLAECSSFRGYSSLFSTFLGILRRSANTCSLAMSRDS